ncbi:hypothetical protein P5E67_13740 [Vibrio parahaemolyticus]|uniref:hypothetical protein n=1 Tax=Vibrio parahaemolyticus TaxID=670 RepID=UPI00132F1E44|nr:hypothetical protein [Vibrio parahaemolyticus]MDG3396841.1 hypothetical protein [Vibrio parahaemolyticus]QHH00056.1 hypothetical protein EHC64_13580 [Vibrio parahaemolyticus]
MKINRLNAFAFCLIFSSLFLLSAHDVMEVFDAHKLLHDRIVVSGAINDASTFAFSWAMFVVSVFMVICLITGKKLLWIPKIFIIILGGVSVLAFLTGWKVNGALKEKLHEKSYIECTSKRELTLKSSSRTYVLDPSVCD